MRIFLALMLVCQSSFAMAPDKPIYEFSVKRIDGTPIKLSEYKGKAMLIVNVASKCGLTPQYEGLEKLYEKYQDKGLVVLGFPANEFMGQEPGTNTEIQEFCRTKFGIKFPMHEKLVVKGKGQHPLYAYLTQTRPKATMKPNGTLIEKLMAKNLLGKPEDIHWNFEKFLVNKKGEIVERFSPELDPLDPLIVKAVEKSLDL
ncbi:MAG TPA: glutathione peroxidase [Bacteriovoracaceae bacterium]|nr:glutathione peroxidase [Bacteriovoracaceae bacterium]